MATVSFLSFTQPKGSAYVLGEGGLITSLSQEGYNLVNHNPDFVVVVVGEGRNFTLELHQ